ncbi:MAG: hypothetical protein ACI33N_03355 [Desulfovibrionaceae bacterium]
MSDVKVVTSMDELFFYVQELNQGAEFTPIQLNGNFTISLHIKGKSWDKRIDSRTAQYVIGLQTAFDDILEEFAPEAEKDKLLVKVENREGSWDSLADITPFLTEVVSKMTDTQTFMSVMASIAGIAGIFIWNRYQTRREKEIAEQEHTRQAALLEQTRQKEEEEKTKQEIARQETLREAFRGLQAHADADPERYASYERPTRNIIKTMAQDDTVELYEKTGGIPAKIAQKCGPRRAPRSEEVVTYADGSYIINSRRYDEGEVVLELQQGNTSIKGYLWQFDENDRAAFIASLDKHEREDFLPFSMNLQINVIHTRRKLKYAIIIGEGTPRESKICVQLDDILP